MAVIVTKTFTTTCPGDLIDAINANGTITTNLEQIVYSGGATSDFYFASALSGPEDTELDNVLGSWTCPVYNMDTGDESVDDTAAADPDVLWSSDKIASDFVAQTTTVTGTNSISGGGDLSANRTFELDGDAASPGNDKLYGTNASGVKGWYDQPSGGAAASELPGCQARRTTTFSNIPLTWTDFSFDTTDVETDDTVIEHNNTNRDDINIKEDGLYWLFYILTCDDEVQGRIRINDSTVIPGSTQQSGDPNDTNNIIAMNTTGVIANLTAGDKVTVQVQAATSAENIQPGAVFVVVKMQGSKGDQGPPGPGSSVSVQDDGADLPNTPHNTLNFTGGATASDGGSGVANINVMRPTFCIWAEENASVSVGANNYEYSFGNGATNNTADPPGIPMGVHCTLIGIGVSARNAQTGTSTVSVSVTNNGSVVATGGIASASGSNSKVQNHTDITPGTANFAPGDTLQFLTASASGSLDEVRVVAWFERTQ